jgi:phosphocarrier protein FPr
VKAQIRALRMDDCRALAERALAAESAEEVRALVSDSDAERATDKPKA